MKRDDFKYFSGKETCCKRLDRRLVTMVFSNAEGLTTKSTFPFRQKVSAFKLYNNRMGGVDLIDQRAAAYHSDRKSTIRFYLLTFFDLIHVACANSYIAYDMIDPNDLTLLDYKIIVSTYLIGRYTSQSRAPSLKQGPIESISISFSKVTYHHILQSFNYL